MEEDVRSNDVYLDGVKYFIEFARTNGGGGEYFSCPCNNCRNSKGQIKLDDIEYHLYRWGIDKKYICWHHHGEKKTTHTNSQTTIEYVEQTDGCEQPRMGNLVDDAYEVHHVVADPITSEVRNEGPQGGSLGVNIIDPETCREFESSVWYDRQ
ncbi:hypothetical protein BVC80_8299g7 [Macleaya cordata]|uniref:Transposase-associated domain-containing protein n=1 Tax=Macleaya cordata TaxID=56857 RepID=A0A200QEA7_MACCD|nr:hypothetical protein BVC80_7777g1 [Macleaya cordata]OVA08783.1 hypothetical protein BVC80_5423g3 [Macleaya cordata]OVA15295.1 hypothetical protein BVC80_8299g7 [Macleaya cordata]